MDRQLHDFVNLQVTGQPNPGGDIAFDEDEGCGSPTDGTTAVPISVISINSPRRDAATESPWTAEE